MNILLDGQDVTSVAMKGIKETIEEGMVFPSKDVWIDLLPAIEQNPELKNNFFSPGIHTISIVDNSGAETAKLFIKSKYSTRNR